MDRVNSRIAHVYGYSVCLVCVIVLLVSTSGFIGSLFDYASPLQASRANGWVPGSFESYRLQKRNEILVRPPTPAVAVTPSTLSDADLRKMYDAEQTQQVESTRFRALKSIVSSLVFIILASVLFVIHWRWIRRAEVETAVV